MPSDAVIEAAVRMMLHVLESGDADLSDRVRTARLMQREARTSEEESAIEWLLESRSNYENARRRSEETRRTNKRTEWE